MDKWILKVAAETLNVTEEEAREHTKPIPELSANYFWNPIRGGISVIISNTGEKLAATSSVSFAKHVQAFRDGKRN